MLRVTVVFEHESQEKVAEFLEAQLPSDTFLVRRLALNGMEDVARVASNRYMTWPDIVVLTIGGRETTAFMAEVRRRPSAAGNSPRPLFVSMSVGLTLDRAYFGGFGFRQASDVVLVNRQSDVERVRAYFTALSGGSSEIRPCRCPIFSHGQAFLDPVQREAIKEKPVKSVLFAVQTDIPAAMRERTYLAQRLIDYAVAHPNRRVIIKPRHELHEKTAHPQRFAYEHIFQRLIGQSGVSNVMFSYGDIPDLLPQMDVLISISSTAIVEALSWGHRAISVLDLGVRENLGNTYFLSSNLLTTFQSLIADEIPLPDTDWLSAELECPDIATVLADLKPLALKAKSGSLPFVTSLFLDRCRNALPAIAPAWTATRNLLSIDEVTTLIGAGDPSQMKVVLPPNKTLLERAKEKLDAGDWVAALDISTSALSRTPAATKHMYVAAEASRKLGRLKEAIRYLQKARELRPKNRRLRSQIRWLKARLWLHKMLGTR